MKKIISTVLAGCMLCASISAAASDINITIDSITFIPMNVNGDVVKPFIDSGSTFLPVRAMGEAVGKEVSFDAENYAVYIGVRPMADEVIKNPVALIGDRVFYEEDLKFYGSFNNMVEAVKLKVLAEKMATKTEIESKMSEVYAFMPPSELESFGGDMYALNEYIEIVSYADILRSKVVLEENFYDNYVTAKHILVDNKTLADVVLTMLADGEDFDNLIEEFNIDPGQTKDSAYTFTYGEMVEEFEKAAFELEEGAYTKEAVETAYGYHIIKRLPLDKESIDTEAYKTNEVVKMVENLELDKAIEVKPEGDYAYLEGFTITTADLEILGGPEAPYSETYEIICTIAKYKKYFETENNLTDAEKEKLNSFIESYLSQAKSTGDDVKDMFFAQLVGYYSICVERMYAGNIPDNFDQTIEAIEIDTKLYKDIKVFVDGKILVPGDVNDRYVAPKNIDGTVYVPVRAIVEALGMSADWDNDTRTVMITK